MKPLKLSPKTYLKLPALPGIYSFLNSKGTPIYIGRSKSLRSRLSSYFATTLEPKTAKMIKNATHITWIVTASEFEATLLEANLINTKQPKYNIQLKDGKSPLYIVITKDTLPIIKTVRQTDLKNTPKRKVFGPYTNGTTAKHVLRTLRKSFPFGDHKPTKRKCIRAHIGLCNPCPSEIKDNPEIKKAYLTNIKQIQKILSGNLPSVKRELQRELDMLSKKEKFEEAQVLLQKLKNLEYISAPQINTHSYIKNPNLIKDIRAKELKRLKSLLKPYININKLNRIECYDVAHLSGTNPTASMVTFINGEPDKTLYRHFKVSNKKLNNDTKAINVVLKRRVKYLNSWGKPNLIIIDGGKGQVSAAQKALGSNIPIIGLAKRTNNLIIKTKSKFITISLGEGPARNLIERLDAEAHRFARRYHFHLIKKYFFKN